MIYLISNELDGMVDVACALATGTVEIENVPQFDGTNNVLQTILKLTSDIRPTNGTLNRLVLSMDDNDVVKFIPTEGMAKKGNILVARRATGDSGLGSLTNATIESFLNDVRKILDGANAVLTSDLAVASEVTNFGSPTVVAWGYLKEDQTEAYNPLTVISSEWTYKMFNPELLQR